MQDLLWHGTRRVFRRLGLAVLERAEALHSSKRVVPLIIIAAIAAISVLSVNGPRFFRIMDLIVFHEFFRDVRGRIVYNEDWNQVALDSGRFDYSWLDRVKGPVMVAHAMGRADALANSIPAMVEAIAQGIVFIEVDLFLDSSGVLRCHHGPESPPKYRVGDCEFTSALQLARASNVYLILDIKTDFLTTASLILRTMDSSSARHVIFQLYQPDHIAYFRKWTRLFPFPGPILTAYRSYRSIGHLRSSANRLGIRVVTAPVAKIMRVQPYLPDQVLLVHPVATCQVYKSTLKRGAAGFYGYTSFVRQAMRSC